MLRDENPGFDALLRRHRSAAGLSQEELAERANLSVRGISNLERGVRKTPYSDTVRRLADALALQGTDRAAFEAASRRAPDPALVMNQSYNREGGRPGNLPRQLSSFVGREGDVAEVQALLRHNPLVTLTGIGGCGKTRLALAVGGIEAVTHADGAWLVDLAAVTDAALVAEAVAAALGVQEQPGVPLLESLGASLGSRDMLLLLDNCEQVVAGCSHLAENLLRACPHLRILATSREPLRVSGEIAWRVPSLTVPNAEESAGVEEIVGTEAARLFTERARASLPGFVVTGENSRALAQICRRLDGIPLALELAAARVAVLSLDQIASRLDDCFRILTGGTRDAPARQQTLRATLDWSYGLLSESQQSLFQRLAVFAGGFTVEAAEAVCAGEGIPRDDILQLLSGLVEKSIVVVDGPRDGSMRYRLLEPVRQYAWERLLGAEELEHVQEQHATYHFAYAEQAAPQLFGPEQGIWLQRLDVEHDNLRAALRWLFDRQDILRSVRLAEALRRFWYARGYLGEARRWATDIAVRARAAGTDNGALARALEFAAELATDQGDYVHAVPLAEEGLRLYRSLKDERGIAFCITILGAVATYRAEYDKAERVYTEALTLYRDLQDARGIGLTLNNLGLVARERGQDERASELYAQSLDIQRHLGDIWTVALVLDNLAEVMRDGGDSAEAVALYEEALRLRRELGDVRGIADTLSALGSVALGQHASGRAAALFRQSLALYGQIGDRWRRTVCLEGLARAMTAEDRYEHAAQLFAAAAHLRGSIGHPVSDADRASYDRDIAEVMHVLGEARFTAAWLTGKTRDPEALTADLARNTFEGGERVGGKSVADDY